jgi:hypothetical protein
MTKGALLMPDGIEVNVPVDESVKPMSVIRVDNIDWTHFFDPTGWIDPGASLKRFAPNFVAPSHWHDNDTIYIIRQGLFIVEGEGEYRPGDVRWVQGGTAYGSERAGPEGCEVFLVTTGKPSIRNPEVEPPPRGYWHEVLG